MKNKLEKRKNTERLVRGGEKKNLSWVVASGAGEKSSKRMKIHKVKPIGNVEAI